jgi:hypothetical protein
LSTPLIRPSIGPRWRVIQHGNGAGYLETFVPGIRVTNAPRTLTPVATALPSATATPTATPTATATPWPTISLDDGASPMLYLTMSTRSDPLCEGEQQRFGIWISNISMVTVTNIVLTDVLPLDSAPLLAQSTPGGTFDGDITVHWELGDLGPGQATKVELQVELKAWAELGTMFENTGGSHPISYPIFLAPTRSSTPLAPGSKRQWPPNPL